MRRKHNWLCELRRVISDLIQCISEHLQGGLDLAKCEEVAVSMMCCPPDSTAQSLSPLAGTVLTLLPGHAHTVQIDLGNPLAKSTCSEVFSKILVSSGTKLFKVGSMCSNGCPLSTSWQPEVGLRMPKEWPFALPYLTSHWNGIGWPPLETDQEMEYIKSLI